MSEYDRAVAEAKLAKALAQLDAANALLREARHQLAKSVEMFDGYQESDLNHECAHRFFVDGEYGTWETARILSAKISTYLKDGR